MKRLGWILVFLACLSGSYAQVDSIETVLQQQADAWNDGNIEGFMEGYWNSDSLVFISPKGVQKGWTETLEAYKKSYPGKEGMGELDFSGLEIRMTSAVSAAVTGAWKVRLAKEVLSGYFLLVFEKKAGKWVITYDHTN